MLLVFTLTFSFGYSQKIFQANSAEEAKVKVFAVEEPDEADLWVCFVWEESEITRTGLWMDMRFDHEADVIIFFVDEEKDSDLKIWLVDTIEESKWLNEEKKNLLFIKSAPN
jgi:hypothetical protein